MKPGIRFCNVSSDVHLIELKIEVSDGSSSFSNIVHLGYIELDGLIQKLEFFRKAIHRGITDIEIGAFGPEYAGGWFHARFVFTTSGIIYIRCMQESVYFDLFGQKVAGNATLYLKTEPALLDNMIEEFKRFKARESIEVYLEGIY